MNEKRVLTKVETKVTEIKDAYLSLLAQIEDVLKNKENTLKDSTIIEIEPETIQKLIRTMNLLQFLIEETSGTSKNLVKSVAKKIVRSPFLKKWLRCFILRKLI